MNERIKELMVNHGLHKHISEDCQHRMEMLAELIVRECANVILEWKSEPFPYDPEFGAKLVKEHFGVQ